MKLISLIISIIVISSCATKNSELTADINMALLTAITIAIALLIDLFFLPTLLITLEKYNLLKNTISKIKHKT